jgi:hypothetical protein
VSNKTYFNVRTDALVVGDELRYALFEKGRAMSASTVSSWLKCPASWVAGHGLVEHFFVVEKDPMSAARWGNFFHDIMEEFYKTDGYQKLDFATEAYKITGTLKHHKDYSDFSELDAFKKWLNKAVMGYSIMESPKDFSVANIGGISGAEYVLNGELCGVKFRGYIDLLCEMDDGTYLSRDWKTGRFHGASPKQALLKGKTHNLGRGTFESNDYILQQVLYTQFLRGNLKIEVNRAELVFPLACKTIDLSKYINDEDEITKCVEELKDVSGQIDEFVESGNAPCKPSPLCSWCQLVNGCPSAPRAKEGTKGAVQRTLQVPSEEFANKIPSVGKTKEVMFSFMDVKKEEKGEKMTDSIKSDIIFTEKKPYDPSYILGGNSNADTLNLAGYGFSLMNTVANHAIGLLIKRKAEKGMTFGESEISNLIDSLLDIIFVICRKTYNTKFPTTVYGKLTILDSNIARQVYYGLSKVLELCDIPSVCDKKSLNVWKNKVADILSSFENIKLKGLGVK